MLERFKRIDRKLIYKGSIVDFYKDTIEAPNGNVVEWDFVRQKGAAAVIAVLEDGRLLMVRQYRNALDRETIEIPAGGLNGETEPTDVAAKRELQEETGYTCDTLEFLMSVRTTVAFCNEKIDIYVAKNLTPGKQHLDEDEFISVEAYTIDQLTEMIIKGEIQDGKTVSGILTYKEKYL